MFQELFREYIETEKKSIRYLLNDEYIDEWDVRRSGLYRNGVVLGKYRENDISTMIALKSHISDDMIRSVLEQYYQNDIEKLIQTKKNDLITMGKISISQKCLTDLKRLSIENWINIHHLWLIKECENKEHYSIEGVINLGYLYFSYSLFKETEAGGHSVYNREQKEIKALYVKNGIALKSYEKYELIPLDQERELILIDRPRIYDKSINKTLFLQNVSIQLATELKTLSEQGAIKKMSFRVDNNGIYNGNYKLEVLLEEIEFGQVFSLVNLGGVELTKLYSNKYDDCLWVKFDSENMTFEELCENFEVNENQIITQVIHLEYKYIGERYYITHIDHEYIFYSLEEYEIRIKDANQKGNSLSRIKTFKVDEAMIPFDYSFDVTWKDENGIELAPVKILFLHFVLECYFKHRDLLVEYFSLVSKQDKI